jgi:hypothetical protein
LEVGDDRGDVSLIFRPCTAFDLVGDGSWADIERLLDDAFAVCNPLDRASALRDWLSLWCRSRGSVEIRICRSPCEADGGPSAAVTRNWENRRRGRSEESIDARAEEDFGELTAEPASLLRDEVLLTCRNVRGFAGGVETIIASTTETLDTPE